MQTTTMKRPAQAGFTLVELAIVLVIIGLIIGGVLVGQDLIKAAEIRATVAQMEDVNAAVNTFRGKFGGVPGDLTSARATQFGLTARNGGDARGDGDGTVEGWNETAATANALGSENALFWVDLSSADFIGEGFATATDAAAAGLTSATLTNYLPGTKLRESTFISVFPSQGRNYFYIDQITATAATTGVITSSTTGGLTPAEAVSIDEKLDDGLPLTGSVLAVSGLTNTGTNFTLEVANTAATANTCVTTATGNPYNVAEAYAAIPTCGLVARTSF